MKRSLPIGRGLLLAFGGLVLLVSTVAWAIARWQTRSLLAEHSRLLALSAELTTADLMRDIFEPVALGLLADAGRIRRGQVRRYDPEALVASFLPELEQLPKSNSMMVADATGYQFLIMKYDAAARASPLFDGVRDGLPPPDPKRPQYFTRDFRPAQWGTTSLWTLLEPDGRTPLRQWRLELRDYDPLRRPWFEAATSGLGSAGGDAAPAAERDEVRWTGPYALFTTRTPGISGSIAARDPGGEIVVVAYDVLLDDLSTLTRLHRPSRNSVVFVFDDDTRLIGLPAHPQFADEAARLAALLRPAGDLGLPFASTVVDAWRRGELGGSSPRRLREPGDRPFWSKVAKMPLGPRRNLWVAVAVPESDLLLEGLRPERIMGALAAASIALSVLLAAALASRFARPLRALAGRSERIARLDLAPQPPLRSRIREVNQLAASLESMRGSLERHLAERAADRASLLVNEQRFRRLVENSVDPIVLFDAEGRIVDFNRAACVESERSPEELAQCRVGDLAPDWRGPSPATLALDLPPDTPVTVRATLRRKSGEEFPAEVRVVRVDADPGHPLLLAMARDVSLRDRLELEARHTQKLAAVGQLAGGIAHDFNNLLTVILGYGDSVRSSLPPDDPLREEVGVIIDTSMRAASMTGQLLALSRRQITAPRTIDLRAEIPQIAKSLLRLLGEDIELRLEIDAATSPIEIDPSELQQLMVNLAVNSRDAMPSGGRLRIEAHDVVESTPESAAATTQVEIVVADEGSGVPPEILERIFEPFFTTKPHGKGTGLGLATCAAIVDRAGGRIWATSEPGGGTAVVVRLPAVPAASAPPRDEPRAGEPPPRRDSGTILLVEDEPGVRAVAERILRESGFELAVAADGVEALARHEELGRPVDLLLTDVVMPRMSGAELALRLRERQPELRLLFVSGYADHATVQQLVRDGAAFLAKPFTSDALLRAVRRTLGSSDETPADSAASSPPN